MEPFEALARSVVASLGQSVTYSPYSGEPVTLTSVVSRGADLGQPDTTGPISMTALVSAFTQIPVSGDYVTVDSLEYRVSDVRHDRMDETYRFVLTETR